MSKCWFWLLLLISLLFGVLRKLNFTRAKACRDTFQDFNFIQLWRTIYKKLRNSEKNNYHSHVYWLYLIYRGDFCKHHVSYNFGGQFTKNYGTQKKTTTTAMFIDFILSIEATFVNITFHTTLEDNLQKTTELKKNNYHSHVY